MAYGGITPDSSASSRPATQSTTTTSTSSKIAIIRYLMLFAVSKDTSQEASVMCPPPHGSPVMAAGAMARTWSRPSSVKTTNTRDHSAATWHGSSVSIDTMDNINVQLLLGTIGIW